jgi:hypothetical protein
MAEGGGGKRQSPSCMTIVRQLRMPRNETSLLDGNAYLAQAK